jgi:TolA-binding protein
MIRRLGRGVTAVGLGLALLGLLGACASDDPSSTAATSTTSAAATTASSSASASASATGTELCAARDDLKQSIDDLKNYDIVKNGTSGLQSALTEVQTDLDAVKSSAGADIRPQVTSLQDALNDLTTAVSNGSVPDAVTALPGVVTNGQALLTSLQNLKCS